jgi:AraC-like DNA-binding protein
MVDTLNGLASKLKQQIHSAGFIIPYYTYQNSIQATIVVDDKCIITNFNSTALDTLGYKPTELLNQQFVQMLDPRSKELWIQTKDEATHEHFYQNTIHLLFSTSDNRIVPAFCIISKLLYNNCLMISMLTTILQDFVQSDEAAITSSGSKRAELIQGVYDYIMNHLDEPLPSTSELSKMFSTNEFNLKHGFKQYFSNSIHQLYNEERLKKAHSLIVQTDVPIKSIAYMTGFNSYINFYKAFKKKFNYSPTMLQRHAPSSE